MRRVLSVLILCLAMLASAQKVDFVAKGEPLKHALERLSEVTGQKLSVHTDLASEIVVIEVTDRDTKELLDKIAEVVHAEWRRTTTGGLMLQRSNKLQRELLEASLSRRAAEVTKYLEQFEGQLATGFTSDDAIALRREIEAIGRRVENNPRDPYAREGAQEAYARGPQARLLQRLLSSIDPITLVDIEYAERRVFKLEPTALQHGFGDKAKEAFAQYVDEQNVWSAVAAGSLSSLNYASNPLKRIDPVSAPPHEWAVEVYRGNASRPLGANLVSWNADGTSTTMYQAYVPNSLAMALYRLYGTKMVLPEELTGVERELVESVSAPYNRERAVLSEEAVQYALQPTQVDPNGLVAHAVLRQHYGDDDVVAVFTDESLVNVVVLLSEAITEELLETGLQDGLLVDIEVNDGWALFTPRDPYLATYDRTPRAELEKYIQKTYKAGRATLLNYAELSAKTSRPSKAAESLSQILSMTENMFARGGSWNLIKLYGLLAPVQRSALEQGLSLKYASLTRDQRTAFQRLAVSRKIDNRERMPNAGVLSVSRVRLEPTEWLANGIPEDAEISLLVFEEPVVYGYQKADDGFHLFSSFFPRNIAMYENARLDPGTFPSTIVIPDAWAMGARVNRDFKLQFSADRWQSFTLTEEVSDPDAKPGSWESLPPEIVEQIRKSMGG